MGQIALKVWFCLETIQESVATRESLRHEPQFSSRNMGLNIRLRTDLMHTPGKKRAWSPCVSRRLAELGLTHWSHTEGHRWSPPFLVLLWMAPRTHTAPCCTVRGQHRKLIHPQTVSSPHHPLPTKILTKQTAECISCTELSFFSLALDVL